MRCLHTGFLKLVGISQHNYTAVVPWQNISSTCQLIELTLKTNKQNKTRDFLHMLFIFIYKGVIFKHLYLNFGTYYFFLPA